MVPPNTSGRTRGIFYTLLSWGFARILGLNSKHPAYRLNIPVVFPANRWRNEFIISNVYLSIHLVYLRDRYVLIVLLNLGR